VKSSCCDVSDQSPTAVLAAKAMVKETAKAMAKETAKATAKATVRATVRVTVRAQRASQATRVVKERETTIIIAGIKTSMR
jgi:hypothetical protein